MIALLLANALAAPTCPAGAYIGPAPDGPMRAVVLGIGPDDAHAARADAWRGRAVELDEIEALGECWYSARVLAPEAAWFYQVAFAPTDASVDPSAVVGPSRPTGPAAIPAGAAACPVGALTESRLDRGRRVRIAAVHPDDAYAAEARAVIGEAGLTAERWDLTLAPCWYTGRFEQANGEQRYFLRVAATSIEAPRVEGTCPPGAVERASFNHGETVKIVAVHPEDPSYGDWSRVIGAVGTVDGGLVWRSGCWVRGAIRTEAGARLRFERVAVWPPGADVAAGAGTRLDGPRVPVAQWVRIVDVHADDAYAPEKAGLVGLRCTTTEALRRQEPGWFSGELRCDDGRTRYFLKVAVELAGPPPR